MIATWLGSKLFRRTELEAEQIAAKLRADCRSGGDFLKIVMEEMARNQSVQRWAAWNPDNIFYMPVIKEQIPEALFIHIIRDGRDVATVLNRKGWIRPFPWDKKRGLLVAGIFWEWMVRKGRDFGQSLRRDYLEVRYEDLATRPHETLGQIGSFVGHHLDYDRIRHRGIGAVSNPNSTFESEFVQGKFNPVGRWKEKLSAEQVASLEQVIGGLLEELHYSLSSGNDNPGSPSTRILRNTYLAYFESKLWLKSKTPVGKFASLESLELTDSPAEVRSP